MSQDFENLTGILITIKEFVGDAAIDTLQVIPFLLVTYIILEFMEHRMTKASLEKFEKAGPLGPIIGSALGIIPQCGFSSMASTFYAGRVITLGTLFAVYLSTSDEMIPIFIAGGIPLSEMLLIIGIKFVIGIIVGFIVDALLKNKIKLNKNKEHVYEIYKLCERDHCSCDHDGKNKTVKIMRPAIQHTFQVTVFIFIITLVINIIIEFTGGFDALQHIVPENKFIPVLATSVVGLIPNCAASVAISQLYVDGILGAGALLAGLLDAAGVGLIVLFRNNRPMKQNIIIVLVIFAISVICGSIVTIFIG